MTILDAYAALAYLHNERAADDVEVILRRGDAKLTAVGVAEVIDRLIRVAGKTEEDAMLDVCHQEGIAFVALPGTDGSTWAAAPGH